MSPTLCQRLRRISPCSISRIIGAMPEVSGRDDDWDSCFSGTEAIIEISQLMLKGTIEISQPACAPRRDKGEIAVHGFASNRLQLIRQLWYKIKPKPRRTPSHPA